MTRNIAFRRFNGGHVLHFISLSVVGLLVLSCFVSVFSPDYLFASASSVQTVSNEAELDKAVTNASGSTVIALTNDITLTKQLLISAGKDITLTSNTNGAKFFKLIGADNQSTIYVEQMGVLRVAGIIVTHDITSVGTGITVRETGKLVLSEGEISGNMGSDKTSETTTWSFTMAGGVYNMGTFEMTGGVIANNTSPISGGGVYNWHIFKMFGGVIANNSAFALGGGVYNQNTFGIWGGVIANNTARHAGGGVLNYGSTV